MCVFTCWCICECIPVSELMCSLESSLKIPPSSVMWLMGTLRLRLSSSDGCNSQQQQQQQEHLLPNYSVRKMINFDSWPQSWMWLLFFLKGHIFPVRIVIRSRCSFGQVSTIYPNIKNLISSFFDFIEDFQMWSMSLWKCARKIVVISSDRRMDNLNWTINLILMLTWRL